MVLFVHKTLCGRNGWAKKLMWQQGTYEMLFITKQLKVINMLSVIHTNIISDCASGIIPVRIRIIMFIVGKKKITD